jgi:hypothetical protein
MAAGAKGVGRVSIGGLLALLVLVLCVVFAFVGGLDLKAAGLIGALALAILLSPYPLRFSA